MNLLRFRRRTTPVFINPIENPSAYLLTQTMQIVDESRKDGYPDVIVTRAVQNANLTYGPFVVANAGYMLRDKSPFVYLELDSFDIDQDFEDIFTESNLQKLRGIANKFKLSIVTSRMGWSLRERGFSIFPSDRNVVTLFESGLSMNPNYKRAGELLGILSEELYSSFI